MPFFNQALTQIATDFTLNCVPCVDQLFEAMATSRPTMIFIDMQLPKKNGIECLKQIKSHPVYKEIPVVLWSTSLFVDNVQAAYREELLISLKSLAVVRPW